MPKGLVLPTKRSIIEQNENYYLAKYFCEIYHDYRPTGIAKIELLQNNKCLLQEKENDKFCFHLDFDSRVEKLKFSFINDIAEPCEFDIVYKAADKAAWDKKVYTKTMEDRQQQANISCATGMDLVNIYFDNWCDECLTTEVFLYRLDRSGKGFMKKYCIESGSFFASITGLAFGEYAFSLKQYDKNENILLETTKISFSLDSPDYSGRNIIGGGHF